MAKGQQQDFAHRRVHIAKRDLPHGLPFGKAARGFERIGQIDGAVEGRHLAGRGGMFFDGREHFGILYPELFPRERSAEARVQQHRMCELVILNRDSSRLALRDQPLVGIEPREIVQHSG